MLKNVTRFSKVNPNNNKKEIITNENNIIILKLLEIKIYLRRIRLVKEVNIVE